MNNKFITILAMTTFSFLTACSSIDNLHPFDDEQAQIILRQNLVRKCAKHIISISTFNDRFWKRIDLSINKQGSPIMLIPCDQTPSCWYESIRTKISAYDCDMEMTAKKFVQTQMEEAKKYCSCVDAKMLAQTPQYVMYSLETRNCSDRKDQIEIGKAFNGSDAVYDVYYTAVNGQVSAKEINKMTYVVKSAELLRNYR